MAIAYDSVGSQSTPADNPSWTHTPVGTLRGVIVFVGGRLQSTDIITSVTYGGVAMTRVAFLGKAATEEMAIYCYFLGANIPTGAQTVAVTSTGSVNQVGASFGVTAAVDTEVVSSDNSSINSDSVANPSGSLALSGKTCFVAEGGVSGQGTLAAVTPPAGWTSSFEVVLGANAAVGLSYKYDTIGSADVTFGWTQAADDAVAIAVAIAEKAAARSHGYIF